MSEDRADVGGFEHAHGFVAGEISGSLGLGLSVARGFVEAMGGSLEPVETPGGGLTMRLTLRRAP